MNPRILGLIRLVAMLTNYGIGYLVYPKRILRTWRIICGKGHQSFTVLEHRLKDLAQRRQNTPDGVI